MKKNKITAKEQFFQNLLITAITHGSSRFSDLDEYINDSLNRREQKWKKFDVLCDKYNLGSGGIYSEHGRTKEYIEKQKEKLLDIDRINDFKKRGYNNIVLSDGRDFFNFNDEKEEWNEKPDFNEKYNNLINKNKKYEKEEPIRDLQV